MLDSQRAMFTRIARDVLPGLKTARLPPRQGTE